MKGMLRRDTVLVACTVTNLVGSVGFGQAAPTTDRVRRQGLAQRSGARPVTGELGRLRLDAEEVAQHDDADDEHEQERDGEDELEGDDASVVTMGSE